MSTSGLQACNRQNAKELDSMKESISDIINQLQDIDPARLSFSPFLDLDTQISMAPVSDSPESSVEELHSSSHSVSGSQRSLEPPAATHPPKSSAPGQQPRGDGLPSDQMEEEEEEEEGPEPEPDQDLSALTHDLDDATENGLGAPAAAPALAPAPQGELPNGTGAQQWSPKSTGPDCTADEDRPLISPDPPPENVELEVWGPGGRPETCGVVVVEEEAAAAAAGPGPRCCKCWKSGQALLVLSALASLPAAAGLFYALYFYVPIKLPDCQETARRILFTFCCCVVAALPILLAILVGAMCQLCSGSLNLEEPFPRRCAVQRHFVSSSLELLLLYVINLSVLGVLLPQEQLKLVPILVAMFVLGRLLYWLSLNVCSSWRGLGSGLTVFPLLALVALNLFLMYMEWSKEEPVLDLHYNDTTTPSSSSSSSSSSPSWSAGETSESTGAL